MDSINIFIKKLRIYKGIIKPQVIRTIRGQAIKGDLKGAEKGLQTALKKKQSNKDKMTNAHRGTRYIKKQYSNIDYNTQLGIYLKGQ